MTAHILITGGSRGIGKAAHDLLSASGARIIALSSKDGDLSDPEIPSQLWGKALHSLDGRIDIVVNNAGIFEANPAQANEGEWLASWNRTLQVNLTAAAQFSRLAVLHWLERGATGRIVNVASRAAHRGDSPQHWHYAASKAGLIAMTKTIARAHAKDGIYAFSICPGFTMTSDPATYMESRGGDKLLADIPLGRVAMPEEVGEMIRWCALSAPPSMTGAVLDVNGASYVR